MFIQVIIRADRVSVCVLRNYKVSVGGVAGERGTAWLSAVVTWEVSCAGQAPGWGAPGAPRP